MENNILTPDQVTEFNQNGVLIIQGFYNLKDIEKIQYAIYQIIGLLIEKHSLEIARDSFSPETFDSGYRQLIQANRSYGGEVYDAVKQIPAFFRMVADPRHESIVCQLRGSELAGIAAGGYGIRIDNPFEEKFRAPWHQEYPAQLRSPDGLVYWSSLIPLTPELGPVEYCLGSHKLGPVPVMTKDPKNPEKSGAYSLIFEDEQDLISQFKHESALTKPGDLVILDFLTLHASGLNKGNRSRWSMQFRYFNFTHPTGVKIGWKGSYAAGQDFRKIHPELCAD